MGAKIIEKHFTLDSKRKGYDHRISLEPKKFDLMVKKIRENEKMIGRPDYKIFNNEKDFQKISKVIRGYKLIRDVNKFLKKQIFTIKY